MTDSRAGALAMVTQISAQARAGADVLQGIARTADALQSAIEHGAQVPVEEAFNEAFKPLDRLPVRGKIEADSALQDLIRARVMTMTFTDIVADVAAHFPPERRVGMSSIHRWWHRCGKFLGPT